MQLRDRVLTVPDVETAPTPAITEAIEDSVRYLGSDAALRCIETDVYWPKWHAPWWHATLLWELGEAQQIPARAMRALVDGMNGLPIRVHPIHPEDIPPGADPYSDSTCHCALGTIYQIVAAAGLDPSRELPWARPWFVRYQMADGGLNCDGDAYLTSECPSSMVGTVAPIEAMLLGSRSAEDTRFLERGARFLVGRKLTEGSATAFNADERTTAPSWRSLTFPRLYFYDVLRGLSALVRCVDAGVITLPAATIEPVVEHLVSSFPDGVVRVQRQAFVGCMSRVPRIGTREPASSFPLLDATSVIGAPSAALTRQWSEVRRAIVRLIDAGPITDA